MSYIKYISVYNARKVYNQAHMWNYYIFVIQYMCTSLYSVFFPKGFELVFRKESFCQSCWFYVYMLDILYAHIILHTHAFDLNEFSLKCYFRVNYHFYWDMSLLNIFDFTVMSALCVDRFRIYKFSEQMCLCI